MRAFLDCFISDLNHKLVRTQSIADVLLFVVSFGTDVDKHVVRLLDEVNLQLNSLSCIKVKWSFFDLFLCSWCLLA